MDYAVLDFTDPGEASVDCQGDYLPIPDGWQLAEASSDTEYAASAYNWGTHVVTTEHRGYNTALCPSCSPESQVTESNGNGEWKPNTCSDRVFISREGDNEGGLVTSVRMCGGEQIPLTPEIAAAISVCDVEERYWNANEQRCQDQVTSTCWQITNTNDCGSSFCFRHLAFYRDAGCSDEIQVPSPGSNSPLGPLGVTKFAEFPGRGEQCIWSNSGWGESGNSNFWGEGGCTCQEGKAASSGLGVGIRLNAPVEVHCVRHEQRDGHSPPDWGSQGWKVQTCEGGVIGAHTTRS